MNWLSWITCASFFFGLQFYLLETSSSSPLMSTFAKQLGVFLISSLAFHDKIFSLSTKLSKSEFNACVIGGFLNSIGNLCIIEGFKFAYLSGTNASEMTALLNLNAVYSFIIGVFYFKEKAKVW